MVVACGARRDLARVGSVRGRVDGVCWAALGVVCRHGGVLVPCADSGGFGAQLHGFRYT